MIHVVDSAVDKAYEGKERFLGWKFTSEKANQVYGENQWLPQETLDAIKKYKVAIKGPLTTPIGGGIRSLNVALRQLDLYVCQRPVRYYEGTPSPVVHPEYVDMVIFRENSEDIYAGIEFEAGSEAASAILKLSESLNQKKPAFEQDWCWYKGDFQGHTTVVKSHRICMHKKECHSDSPSNIMKFTEGAFCHWGYELADREYGAKMIDGGPWRTITRDGHTVIIKDVIADAFLQQILLRPKSTM